MAISRAAALEPLSSRRWVAPPQCGAGTSHFVAGAAWPHKSGSIGPQCGARVRQCGTGRASWHCRKCFADVAQCVAGIAWLQMCTGIWQYAMGIGHCPGLGPSGYPSVAPECASGALEALGCRKRWSHPVWYLVKSSHRNISLDQIKSSCQSIQWSVSSKRRNYDGFFFEVRGIIWLTNGH